VVSSIATESLNSFFNENPEITKKILSKSISALRAREAAQKEGDEMGGSIPGALSLAKVFIMALDINLKCDIIFFVRKLLNNKQQNR